MPVTNVVDLIRIPSMKRPDFKSYIFILAICQSEIIRCQHVPYGENVALNKPATQSSYYEEDGFTFIASLGVDGKTSTDFYRDKTCSHTNSGHQSAWWTVNLNGLFFIKFIRIYQNMNQYSYNTLDGSMMYVRVEDGTWQHIQFNSNWPPERFDVNVTLDKRISSITLNNTKLTTITMETFISICELEAYEVLACSPYIVRNGRVGVVKLGDSNQKFTYGANLNVTCENGYRIGEDNTILTKADIIIECTSTMTWSINLTCSDINECSDGNDVCNNNGNCTNNPGSFNCECLEGFNGKACNEGQQQDHSRNDKDDHQKLVLPTAILLPVCLILIVTNTVTCLRLRRYAGYDNQQREHNASDLIIAQSFPSGLHDHPMTEQASFSHSVDESNPERTQSDTIGSHYENTGLYDELQRNTKQKSEYDKLKF